MCAYMPTPQKKIMIFFFSIFYERKRRKMYYVDELHGFKIRKHLLHSPQANGYLSPKTTAVKCLTESMIVLVFRE